MESPVDSKLFSALSALLNSVWGVSAAVGSWEVRQCASRCSIRCLVPSCSARWIPFADSSADDTIYHVISVRDGSAPCLLINWSMNVKLKSDTEELFSVTEGTSIYHCISDEEVMIFYLIRCICSFSSLHECHST
jgi:hypothetical protein